MSEYKKQLVEDIRMRSLALGALADEAFESAYTGKYMAALACLFILVEQSVKQANEVLSGNFQEQISVLFKNKHISKRELDILTNLRSVRNTLFHENHYMYVIVDKSEKATMFSEFEAKKDIWNKLSLPSLKVCHRLVTN